MHLHLTIILSFPGHNDKPNLVKYHPVASGVLASSSLDLTVKIWDINKAKALITLTGHNEQVRCKMTSENQAEKQAEKFHTDDASLPRSG